MKRELALCPGTSVDEIDHAVVRHEVWHAIQHCVNVARGTPLNYPVNPNERELMAHVRKHVPQQYIDLVHNQYEPSQWLLEFEANVAMFVLTADEIQQLFDEACMA